MHKPTIAFDRSRQADLEQMIEPLASFICAAERPRTALRSALAMLFVEVEQVNRTAVAHFGALARSHRS